MVLAALIAIAAFAPPVADFFPVAPGTKWTYEDADGRQLEQQIGPPVDIGKELFASPLTSSAGGRKIGTDLYRVDTDTVYLVGYMEKVKKQDAVSGFGNEPPPVGKPKLEEKVTLLPDPQPMLRVSKAGKAEWKYLGQVFSENGPVAVQISCDSNNGPRRRILDREVETLVVHSTLRFGEGRSASEIRRDMIYGKGLGMVETIEATKIQGRTVKKVLKLIKFEPPQD